MDLKAWRLAEKQHTFCFSSVFLRLFFLETLGQVSAVKIAVLKIVVVSGKSLHER